MPGSIRHPIRHHNRQFCGPHWPKPSKFNKTRTGGRYRLIFNSTFLSTLLQRDAEAFSLAVTKLKTDLIALGRPTFLDPDNRTAFDNAVNAKADGTWVSRFNSPDSHLHRIRKCFIDGFLQDPSPDFETSFEIAAKFSQCWIGRWQLYPQSTTEALENFRATFHLIMSEPMVGLAQLKGNLHV